ncbi:hypothetical protein Y900_028725 [Mycolicibacterium aromaticivorans JS19b1 = JCM 16368]|uniref:DUF2637 domain-containing protein n=1 Tax=Mycolicibacterium aromaticivorans JS19b1 = JCM 16368 TaxID=1440774 RepID=A0A064CC37_9MYCO|nr:DUF2637 domain-containing protein [Mycolicibacterium aromaticivorans]KDE97246.1 hypothetical protein Y900_028725 [Mycolicibacterium aromaticivorans JS19b1 = JCM 16368]
MTAVDNMAPFIDGEHPGLNPVPSDVMAWLEPEVDDSARGEVPPLVRVSRAVAVAITAAIAISSFILSFAALSDLARRTGSWTGWLPYLWPGIVDGAIVLATMGILATAAYPDQRKNRQFFWAMLGGGALVSVGGNALHAILPATAPLPTALAFAVACVPPAGILGSTHAVQILWRFNPSREMASSQPRRTVEVPVPADHDRGQRWLQLAREIHTRGRLTNHSETTLSQALWRLFEVRPQMSLRAIGEEVGVGHHDVIARIRQTATEVVRERPELVPMPVAIEGQPGLAS